MLDSVFYLDHVWETRGNFYGTAHVIAVNTIPLQCTISLSKLGANTSSILSALIHFGYKKNCEFSLIRTHAEGERVLYVAN